MGAILVILFRMGPDGDVIQPKGNVIVSAQTVWHINVWAEPLTGAELYAEVF